MLYCPNCKTENKPEANYCSHCSQKLDLVNTSTSSGDTQTLSKNETGAMPSILEVAIAGGLILGGLVIKQWLNKGNTISPQEKQAPSQGKVYKAVPASDKVSDTPLQMREQREARTRGASEACEVVVCMVSIPNPGPWAFLPTTYMNFQAETRGQKEARVVATGSQSFQVDWSELEAQALEETRERRKDLDALREKLIKDGWEPSSHGECWYSYRFTR